MQIELLHKVSSVGLYRVGTQVKKLGHLLVGLPLGEELQNLLWVILEVGILYNNVLSCNMGETGPYGGAFPHVSGMIQDGERLMLFVSEYIAGAVCGAVVHGDDLVIATHGRSFWILDDVTPLVRAQKVAAWREVARRLAHEIKNPLTPIQLSAERLRRKYGKVIVEDRAVFEQCTDTIVRQVDDIKRMVDEFSSFARMPRPTVHPEDVKELCQQALFLQRSGNAGIKYRSILPDHPVSLICDRRQVGQVLTNILKNAGEAIEGRDAAPGRARR